MVHLRLLVFLVVLSATLAYRAREKRKRGAPYRRVCPPSMSLCKCGRRGEVTCLDENCLQQLPTANMTTREGASVRSLFVSRQKDLLVIGNDDLGEVPNLRRVKLINNRMLGAIQHNAFQHTPHVTQLDLHHNAFKSFPSAIRYLGNLISLNLGGNQISYIPTSAFDNNPNLQRLILRRNKIEHFPQALPAALVKLSIGQNLIYSLEDISHLKNLTVVRLNSNRLTLVQAGLLPTSLRELSICQNLLTSQSLSSIDNLVNLRKLRLAGNTRIGRIRRETFFKSTNQLRELDLRYSEIRVVDRDAFANLYRLRVVDLSGNRVTRFEGDWLKYSRKLERVSLANNTWHCTCDMHAALIGFQRETLRRASTNHRKKYFVPTDFENIDCASLDYTLRLSNMEAMESDVSHKMAAYNFLSCPEVPESWEMKRAPSSEEAVTTKKRTTTTMSTTTEYATRKPITTAASKTTTRKPTMTTTKPTTTETTTTKPTTTRKPTTTKTTTTRKPTTTETTTRKPTTTSTATTTTTTKKPTTTRTTTTTAAATTKPTTKTGKEVAGTTTNLTAVQENPTKPFRLCTKSGDCVLPFTDGGIEFTDTCAPGTWGSWCKTAESWDYCKPCTQ